MKKLLTVFLIITLLPFSWGIVSADEDTKIIEDEVITTFKDIEGHWAKSDIEFLFDYGLVAGYGDSTYAPDNQVTRAEFATMILNGLKLSPMKYDDAYSDVKSADWYARTVQILYNLECLDSDVFGRQFEGDKPITREEMASVLINGYSLYGALADNASSSFSDVHIFSDWAKPYADQATALGFMQGKANNSFDPSGALTRAEAAAVIRRMLNKFTAQSLDFTALPWIQAPVIFKVDDEIKPGDGFQIFGAGLSGKETNFFCKYGSYTSKLEVLQRDSEDNFVVAVLPEDAPGGQHEIWGENEYGRGSSFIMNKANPRWFAVEIGRAHV